jgi:phage terminase large subunit-like protein
MAVSGVVALAGAVFAAFTIRAKRKGISAEAAEAEVNPGGEMVAAHEAVAAGEPAV